MLIINNEITIRSLEDHIHDYQLMVKWSSDEKVLQFYGGRDHPYDLEKVIETYQPRIKGQEALIPCIFAYQKSDWDLAPEKL
ncbi:MAG: hypothetical protein ACKO11_13115 [Cuspidothrix sp.]